MRSNKIALDLRDESFNQRLNRLPDILTRNHLVTLRLFQTIDAVNFAVQRNKIPFIKKGRKVNFDKRAIKQWLKTRDL